MQTYFAAIGAPQATNWSALEGYSLIAERLREIASTFAEGLAHVSPRARKQQSGPCVCNPSEIQTRRTTISRDRPPGCGSRQLDPSSNRLRSIDARLRYSFSMRNLPKTVSFRRGSQ